MSTKFKVGISRLIKEFNLEVAYTPGDTDNLYVTCTDVNRPGLQLAGFFTVFERDRTQVLGKSEMTYLSNLELALQHERMEQLCAMKPPAIIIARGASANEVIICAARKYAVPVLLSKENTSEFIAALIAFLCVELAPRITRHGVLLEIYGDGVLILGESGIGKSETAVELIARGHRIISDDAVEIKRVSARALIGSSPDNIRHFMELRGIGIINAQRIFGMGAVKTVEKIDMIIQLELWKEDKVYDRLGAESEVMEILGIRVPALTIPVKPGRNLAVIIEVAVMNHRLKKMGYHPTRELMKGLGMPDDLLPPIEVVIPNPHWDSKSREVDTIL